MKLKNINKNFQLLKKNIQAHPQLIILIVILIMGFILRFYNTPGRYSVGGDSSRDGIVAFVGAHQMQMPLTGPFSSAGQFTFGPWYYYQLIIFSVLTPFEYAPWIYMGLISTAFIFVMYKLGEYLFDKKFGLIAAAITALCPYTVITGTGLSNPYLISFFAGMSLLFFFKLLKGSLSVWASILMGFFIGVGINTHYQMLGYLWLFPLLLVFKKKQRVSSFVFAILGFGVSFIPLLFFDLLNHWFTLRHLSHYYLSSNGRVYIATRWLTYLGEFWPKTLAEIIGVPPVVSYVLFVSIALSVCWLIYKKKISILMVSLAILFAINFVMLRYYWGEKFVGYLQYYFPMLFLGISLPFWILSSKKTYYSGLVLLILLLILIFPKARARLETFRFDQEMHNETQAIMDNYPNQPIIIYNCGSYYWDRSQAVSLLLRMQNVQSDSGRKIGFMDNRCIYPVPGFNPLKDATPSASTINSYFPKLHNVEAIDLSRASDAALLNFGWKPVRVEGIYNSTIKWWYDEKP